MSLTRPIPETAYRVLDIIRKEVPKPSDLPRLKLEVEYDTDDRVTSWRYLLRWDSAFCPMGFHVKACSAAPSCAVGFLRDDSWRVTDEQVSAFLTWFDEQHDAQGAVDAIWGEEAK